jgi:predicted Holliday junction resolvase-like endonuclease
MGFIQMLADNIWLTVVLLLFIISMVSIVLGILLEVSEINIRASEKRMELRNEEMRLQLRLEQQKKENAAGSPSINLPQPKEPSWEEQSQISYEMGYQQHK